MYNVFPDCSDITTEHCAKCTNFESPTTPVCDSCDVGFVLADNGTMCIGKYGSRRRKGSQVGAMK